MQTGMALIVFSHLRWDFVYQRPQQVLSRLAAAHPVYFVEEPLGRAETPCWGLHQAAPNVTVCRPSTPQEGGGFDARQTPFLRDLMRRLLEEQGLKEYILWFYSPLALPAASELRPAAVVYDCMDELAAFLGAPPELVALESELLAKADLVFTGGRSLWRAKTEKRPGVYCFPSSVDTAHFATALNGIPEAADQSGLKRPRFGYYGVIDERMDLPLVGEMADAHPEWQLALVGPVVKIDPLSLPQRPNIRYFGQRPYSQLPSYLKGWDVCVMPFARNRSTEFISPTKTLEYMAAAKPIASTPIRDVAEPYSEIVYLGENGAGFIQACERALQAGAGERAERREKALRVLGQTSWDTTASQMRELIAGVLEAKLRSGSRRQTADRNKERTVVIGAGPTGLSAAYHLGEDSILLEKDARVGGLCRSIEVDGFTFDYAGHIMFSDDPYVHQLYRMLLGDNVHWQDREAWVYSKNVFTRYPFQGSLYGLPPKVIKECIVGAIEARFGPLKAPRSNGGTNGRTNGGCKPEVKDCCGDGVLEASAPLGNARLRGAAGNEPRNFEEFIYKVWGAGIAKHFAIPYNRKLWATPLHEMETSWLGGRVPLPNLEEMIEGALSPSPKPMGPNARFGYPLRGGFQALMDAWLPHLKGEVRLNSHVVGVSPSRRAVWLADGSATPYNFLISTMPLPILVRQIRPGGARVHHAAAERLRHVSVRCVHLGVGRERLTEKHWIYYPEDTVFHRIFVQGNASPYCNQQGGFGLTCEITYSPHKPLPCDGDALIERCVADCRRVGMIAANDPIWTAAQCDLRHAYVVYDHGRAQAVQEIREWLAAQNILLAGRYSEWEYYNSDHAFIAGKKAVEQLKKSQPQGADPAGRSAPEPTAIGAAN